MKPRVLLFLPPVLACLLISCAPPSVPALPTDFATTIFPSAMGSTSVRISPTPSLTTATTLPSIITSTSKTTPTPTRTALPTELPWWHPQPGLTWEYQLSGEFVDDSYAVDAYDIDLFDTSADIVASLHLKQRKVICYFSAGTFENWREDKAKFTSAVIGLPVQGWPGEQWLDVRAIDTLAPILRARLDLCGAKGFDAVEADNVDGYQNASGFSLKAADQLKYNRWLAAEAHKRGLAIALKNDPDQAADLVSDFDLAIAEECFNQGWCNQEQVFLQSGKPVLDVEYSDSKEVPSTFCPLAKKSGIRAIYKKRNLDSWSMFCP